MARIPFQINQGCFPLRKVHMQIKFEGIFLPNENFERFDRIESEDMPQLELWERLYFLLFNT